MFDPKDDMNKSNKDWIKKQKISKEIQGDIFPDHKYKSMTEILNRQFAGHLAEEGIKYLQELGFLKLKVINKPNNLTRNESEVFDLLIKCKNRIVSFDEIANCIWKDKSEEKYSEYAITKLIERLKRKLPKYTIHTQRCVGYILVSS